MEKFKGYKAPYSLGSKQVNQHNATGQNIDAINNGCESFATFWLWNNEPNEKELATINVMLSGPELLQALQNLIDAVEEMESTDQYISEAKQAVTKALGK